MKNLSLSLLFTSLCILSFSACADDKETAAPEKVVEISKETASETVATNVREKTNDEEVDEEKVSTETTATNTKKEGSTDKKKKQGDEEEPECD